MQKSPQLMRGPLGTPQTESCKGEGSTRLPKDISPGGLLRPSLLLMAVFLACGCSARADQVFAAFRDGWVHHRRQGTGAEQESREQHGKLMSHQGLRLQVIDGKESLRRVSRLGSIILLTSA